MKTKLALVSAFCSIILFSCEKKVTSASQNSEEVQTENFEKTEVADLRRGLMAYYAFNGNTKDSSPNKLKAYLMNGAKLGTDRFNNKKSCLELDGIDDYAIVYDNGLLNSTTLTLSCEYQTVNATHDQVLFGRIKYSDGVGGTYALALTPDGNGGIYEYFHALAPYTGCFNQVFTNYSNYVVSPVAQAIGGWHNVIGTFENGVGKIFIDGKLALKKEFDYTEAKTCTNTDFLIGCWHQAQIPLQGKIDNIRVYDRALNKKEIKILAHGF